MVETSVQPASCSCFCMCTKSLYRLSHSLGNVDSPSCRFTASRYNVTLFGFGTLFHYGADAQKHFVLKARPGLITDGFFAHTRNPNYLGEILLYAGFATLSMHWVPWLVNAFFWSVAFVPNMKKKDASMSRYPEWEAYVARTGLLLPKLSGRGEAKTAAVTPGSQAQ